MLVLDETKVILDLWQSTRSESRTEVSIFEKEVGIAAGVKTPGLHTQWFPGLSTLWLLLLTHRFPHPDNFVKA